MVTTNPPIRAEDISFGLGSIYGFIREGQITGALAAIIDLQTRIAAGVIGNVNEKERT